VKEAQAQAGHTGGVNLTMGSAGPRRRRGRLYL